MIQGKNILMNSIQQFLLNRTTSCDIPKVMRIAWLVLHDVNTVTIQIITSEIGIENNFFL